MRWTRCSQQIVSRSGVKSFFPRISAAFANISLLMYASSTQLCLSLLHCVPISDNKILFLDGNVKYYQDFQYFLLVYMISSVLPFCLVPVFDSYLLKLNHISVAQYCLACIFPLPFCCYWVCLLVSYSSWRKRYSVGHHNRNGEVNDENPILSNTSENRDNEKLNENIRSETDIKCSKAVVLRVISGPFRPHERVAMFL